MPPRRSLLALLALGASSALPAALTAVESLIAVSRNDPSYTHDTAAAQSWADRAISSDGRYVAFQSSATNLVAGTVVSGTHAWLHDRIADTNTLVSHAAGDPSAGASGGGVGVPLGISGDGRWILYQADYTDLIPGYTGSGPQLFLYDRLSSSSALVSHAVGGPTTAAAGGSYGAALSEDGRWVAFSSDAPDLVAGYTGSGAQLYLYDRDSSAIVLASPSTAGATTGANGPSHAPVLSGDGAYLAFWSAATDLFGAGSSYEQVYLFTRATSAVSRVSHAAGDPTAEANSTSRYPSMSDDGRYILFYSAGSNLVAGFSGPAFGNVFLWDRLTATTVLASHGHTGPTVAHDSSCSYPPELSGDGGWAAFDCGGTNLIAGYTGSGRQMYLWSRASGTVSLASHSTAGVTFGGDDESFSPSLSGDGRYLVFGSAASDLVPGQTGAGYQLFLYDRDTTAVGIVNHVAGSPTTVVDINHYHTGTLSEDGGQVVFASPGGALVANDNNNAGDAFLHATASGENHLISKRGAGAASPATGNGQSGHVFSDQSATGKGVSDDGNFVTFESLATNLVPGYSGSPVSQVFQFDRAADEIELVSHAAGAVLAPANAEARQALSSADGRYVAYRSAATNLVTGYAGAGDQIWLWDRLSGETTLVSHDAASLVTGGNAAAFSPFALSDDGRFLAFRSSATNLVAGYSGSGSQVYLWDRVGGSIVLASRATGGATTGGNAASQNPRLSGDGRHVLFVSQASDLVAGYAGPAAVEQVFSFDRDTGIVTLISRTAASAFTGGSASSQSPHASADGRYVAFKSAATDLVAGYVGSLEQVYLWERVAGATTLVTDTVSAGPTGGAGTSQLPVVSADGEYVAFVSNAQDLTGTTAPFDMIYLWQRTSGALTLASHAAGASSSAANFYCSLPRISADGRYVAFTGQASDLVAGYTGVAFDVYRFDRLTGENRLLSHRPGLLAAGGDSLSFAATIAADGNSVAFWSGATNLVADDLSGHGDLFLWADLADTTAPSNASITATDPNPAVWTNDDTIQVSWAGAADAGVGVAGYSFLFDDQPATLPDATVDLPHTSDPHMTTSAPLGEGAARHFHLRTCDLAGNCSTALHAGPFQIDLTQPGAASDLQSPSHMPGTPSNDPTIQVTWAAAVDGLSGVAGYSWSFSSSSTANCDPTTEGDESALVAYSNPLMDGEWWFHLCALDEAGNLGPPASLGPFVLDSTPPQVALVHSVGATAGGELAEGEKTAAPITQLLVTFDEPMAPGPLTSAANWLLVEASIDLAIDTASCAGGVHPDDIAVPVDGVAALGASGAAVAAGGGMALPRGTYALFACDTLVDGANNSLDGDFDTVPGGDFGRLFGIQGTALFANPNLDGGSAGWSLEGAAGATMSWSAADANGAPTSGSLLADLPAGVGTAATASQCIETTSGAALTNGLLNLSATGLTARLELQYFGAPACTSPLDAPRVVPLAGGPTAGWVPFAAAALAPAGRLSVEARLVVQGSSGTAATGGFDQLALFAARFASGFESGDLSDWSTVFP